MGLRRRKRSPGRGKLLLGLDLGSSYVKAVALSQGKRSPRLAAVDQEPLLPDGTPVSQAEARDTILMAVRRLLDRMQIAPAQVERLATSVGGPNVTVGEFEMPRMSSRDLRKAIPWEARKHLPDDARVFDYQMLESANPDKVRIILASVPQPQLEQHVALVRAAGLEPERVEASPIALTLACRRLRGEAAPDACVVLDVGSSGTTLVIGEESGPFFSRYLDIGLGSRSVPMLVTIGGSHAGEPSTEETSLVHEAHQGTGALLDELVLEVRRSMAFFGSHYGSNGIERLVFTGGGAMHEQLGRALGGLLGIPIVPFAYRGNRAVPRVEAPYAIAYGLAVRLGS